MFRIGFVQFSPARHDVAGNLVVLQRLLDGVNADLLVLPELANSGYLFAAPEDVAPLSEPGDGSGPFLAGLVALAARTGGAIITGFAERAPEGLYNSAAAVDATGCIRCRGGTRRKQARGARGRGMVRRSAPRTEVPQSRGVSGAAR
jgi:predicted amidohydrolase